MADGGFLEVINVLYGFATGGDSLHKNFLHILRGLGFNQTCFEPYV